MTVVCLGWGSLIWNPGSLRLAGGWDSDGPSLPIEFARQSDNGRITLVLTSGAPRIPVLWAEMVATSMEDATKELAQREGISAKNTATAIGFWSSSTSPKSADGVAIGKWATARRLDGVVWTALRPRFGREYRTPSESEVIEYLASLTGDVRAEAETYCRRAPAQIRTPYRAAIEARLGWT